MARVRVALALAAAALLVLGAAAAVRAQTCNAGALTNVGLVYSGLEYTFNSADVSLPAQDCLYYALASGQSSLSLSVSMTGSLALYVDGTLVAQSSGGALNVQTDVSGAQSVVFQNKDSGSSTLVGGSFTLELSGGAASPVQPFDATQAWSSCIFAIQNQEQCGSCYTFASSEVLSNRLCISQGQTANVNRASPQFLLNCAAGAGTASDPCSGGSLSGVFSYLASSVAAGGVATCADTCTDGCMPYTAGNCPTPGAAGCTGAFGSCGTGSCGGSAVLVASQAQPLSLASASLSDIMNEISTNGPVAAGIAICESFMTFYQSATGAAVYTVGCTTESSDYEGGHAIKVVGWTNVQGLLVWKIANSWGASWGDNGYFYLPMGVDACGVESMMYTVLVNGQTSAARSAVAKLPEPAQRLAPLMWLGAYVQHGPRASHPLVSYFLETVFGGTQQLVSITSVATQIIAGVQTSISLTAVDDSGQMFAHRAFITVNLAGARHCGYWESTPISSGSLSGGQVAGIVVGCVAGAAALALAVALAVRRYRARAASRAHLEQLRSEPL